MESLLCEWAMQVSFFNLLKTFLKLCNISQLSQELQVKFWEKNCTYYAMSEICNP